MSTVPKATLVLFNVVSLRWTLDRRCPSSLLLHCLVKSLVCHSLVSQDHMDRSPGTVEVDLLPSL